MNIEIESLNAFKILLVVVFFLLKYCTSLHDIQNQHADIWRVKLMNKRGKKLESVTKHVRSCHVLRLFYSLRKLKKKT